MTHFLDTLPFDWSQPAAQELRNFLADNYFKQAPVIGFVQAAGMQPEAVNWEQSMLLVWHEVIQRARAQDKLRALLQAITQGADAAVGVRLRELLDADPVTAAPPTKQPAAWNGFDDRDALERQITSESTLLDVAFLARGAQLAPAVARLLVTLPSGKYYGTAFRIGDDLLLTNHHVLYDDDHGGEQATDVEAWFGYERAFGGEALAHTVVMGRPDTIKGSLDHDWAVIRLNGPTPADTPTITLSGGTPVEQDDRVYIIQHPNGGVKKIGMVHNVVRFADDDVVQYWTDTEGGSSGSPVFNEAWELVALHHKWVEHTSGETVEYRNQGQRIERVVEGLTAAGLV